MATYRFRFEKKGELQFISHLDLSHAFERAARRARVPLAFTQGFHPHPKIAFATALSVGTTSEAEYVDIETASQVPIGDLMEALNKSLPAGMTLTAGVVASPSAKSLMASVCVASYRVGLSVDGLGRSEVLAACEALLAREAVPVRKKTKSGVKEVDLRPLISALEVSTAHSAPGAPVEVTMLLACGSNGMAKPEDVVEALKQDGMLGAQPRLTSCHRTGLYQEKPGGVLADLFGA